MLQQQPGSLLEGPTVLTNCRCIDRLTALHDFHPAQALISSACRLGYPVATRACKTASTADCAHGDLCCSLEIAG